MPVTLENDTFEAPPTSGVTKGLETEQLAGRLLGNGMDIRWLSREECMTEYFYTMQSKRNASMTVAFTDRDLIDCGPRTRASGPGQKRDKRFARAQTKMTILFKLDTQGGFAAGDTKTSRTAYAYPTKSTQMQKSHGLESLWRDLSRLWIDRKKSLRVVRSNAPDGALSNYLFFVGSLLFLAGSLIKLL
jgi:hypothetical protein